MFLTLRCQLERSWYVKCRDLGISDYSRQFMTIDKQSRLASH
jgi:hypothetical protein